MTKQAEKVIYHSLGNLDRILQTQNKALQCIRHSDKNEVKSWLKFELPNVWRTLRNITDNRVKKPFAKLFTTLDKLQEADRRASEKAVNFSLKEKNWLGDEVDEDWTKWNRKKTKTISQIKSPTSIRNWTSSLDEYKTLHAFHLECQRKQSECSVSEQENRIELHLKERRYLLAGEKITKLQCLAHFTSQRIRLRIFQLKFDINLIRKI